MWLLRVLSLVLLYALSCAGFDATTQCGAIGTPCTNYTDCCDDGNGVGCTLPTVFNPRLSALCASCKSGITAHNCTTDADCCGNAPYPHKGWCRWDRVFPYSDIRFCAECQPNGGPCGPPDIAPGFDQSACCSYAGQACNTTPTNGLWLCYGPTTATPAPSVPTRAPTLVKASNTGSRTDGVWPKLIVLALVLFLVL